MNFKQMVATPYLLKVFPIAFATIATHVEPRQHAMWVDSWQAVHVGSDIEVLTLLYIFARCPLAKTLQELPVGAVAARRGGDTRNGRWPIIHLSLSLRPGYSRAL